MPRTRTILIIALGSLIALVALAGWSAVRRATRIYGDAARVRQEYSQRQKALVAIESDIYQSAIFVRDYLLDPSHITAPMYRERLLALRRSINGHLRGEDPTLRKELETEIDAYWNTMEPVFTWTPVQKMALSSAFLSAHVLPRRDAVLAIARDIEELNEDGLRRHEQELDQRQERFRRELRTLFSVAVGLAVLVAVTTILYISRLERRAEAGRRRAEQAEREMRRLSQQLVDAQEEERRSLSRELHDHLGQMLTALRIDLGNAASSPEALEGAKVQAEQALQAVRNLSMGLRPSMLDDLGLAAALDWQAREFSRRSGVPVSLEMDGNLEGVPEAHRTCVYRVVQEALTNCARHARARSIRILLHGRAGSLALTVQDDGVGFIPEATRGRGLGLIGIEERVHKLGGKLAVLSQPGKGTALAVELPLPVAARA